MIHYFEIQPFIVTLAGMFLARGLCYVDHAPTSIPIDDPTFVDAGAERGALLGEHVHSPRRDHRAGRRR